MTSGRSATQQILGWIAVALSTLLACFWAFWGINENFHEGWYDPSLLRNLALMLVQYLSPVLIVILISAASLRWPRFAFLFWERSVPRSPGSFTAITPPSFSFCCRFSPWPVLYTFGRPPSTPLAWRLLLGLPLLTLVARGVWPAWRAIRRFDDGNTAFRTIAGNGVTLVWAPEGPGWPSSGVSWYHANQACAFLDPAGLSLADQPQYIWRLPTIEDAVRSLVFRGSNGRRRLGSIVRPGPLPHCAPKRIAPLESPLPHHLLVDRHDQRPAG